MACNHHNDIINILINDRSQNDPCRFNELVSEKSLIKLCADVREVFMNDDMLLKLKAPITVCGDIHGQYADLLKIFDVSGTPPHNSFLFLGDYVDRGGQSLECVSLLFALKVKYPDKMFILRGNHEDKKMNEKYGFSDECKRRYSTKLLENFFCTFDCMPVAAVINKKIFCCHGGLSRSLSNLKQICELKRPCRIPDNGIMCDLVWSDPNKVEGSTGWEPSKRGISYCFGEDVVKKFLKEFDFEMILRAHQMVHDGYEFYADGKLVTIFSAPLYAGRHNNDGAILKIDSNLECQFHILRPKCVKY